MGSGKGSEEESPQKENEEGEDKKEEDKNEKKVEENKVRLPALPPLFVPQK